MSKRVVFLGSDGVGVDAVKFLYEFGGQLWQLIGVVSGPDRAKGRGLKLTENPIVALAKVMRLPLFQPEHPKTDLLPILNTLQPDIGVVFSYGHILRQDVLDLPPLGWLNLHASLLPELRGPSPLIGAILERKNETGISLMQLVRRMDAGPVYGSVRVQVEKKETVPTLRKKISAAAVMSLKKFFQEILNCSAIPAEQDEQLATYTYIIRKEDGLLDFKKSSAELEAQVRAYCEWPRSFFMHSGEYFYVGMADALEECTNHAPGTIFGVKDGAVEIATGNGILRCLLLQRPTRKMLPADVVWKDFLLCKNG